MKHKLNQIAKLANTKLNANVFEVIDNVLINIEGRQPGWDLSLTIEDNECIARVTGDTSYYGHSDVNIVANDIVEAHKIWIA